MRLHRCRTVWGETALVADLPGSETVSDALYLPSHHDGPWGLFSGRRPLGGTGHGVPDGDLTALPDPAETAPETAYLYIGPVVPHYGHFITDTLSRLWPLLAWDGPPPKLLCHRPDDHAVLARHGFVAQMLAGLGLGTDDFVSFDRPVRIPRVIVPEPSFHTRMRVHAVFGELCRTIGRWHWQDGEVDSIARPAYLAKTALRSGMSQLTNEAQVAAALERAGVEIAHPETLGFGEQVRLFATRRIVLGPAGSAFHTSAFSAPSRRIVGLIAAEYLNANFSLFDAVAGARAYYYWAHGTTYGEADAFGVRWTVPEPERVAAELLESVAAFERLDARDAAEDAARARHGRRLGVRLRRWRRRLGERLSRRF